MTLELDLRDLATDIAREAGELAKRRRDEGVAIAASKSTLADIVTEADREVEALIRSRLAEARPDDGFLGEESGGGTGASEVTWVVDPIDGTVNYAFGQPAYGVSIAAVTGPADPLGWQVIAGAVAAPALGEMFSAARGHGAFVGDRRLSVTAEAPAGALVATGFGYDPETHASALDELRRVMPIARDIRRAGAASLDLAYVAAGRLDAYYERGLKPWDMAAGSLLVTEAGGRLGWFETDAWGRRMMVAASAAVYDRLVEVLAT
ncbi:inositol monophosphatase [Microbacterium barkeri]|uniref:Inositol-1-monophosphatase n=1 Tax=Microbacterium barkeri TaxID=33917 RepID=A0A9W6H4G0_9MICO|nr:inositol monophosphatase family protein [Microbacterium barkeri]MDR6877041.1 myo-inositol-1(or 4)-monophosphatase [Microbacterium barkeri]GLJ61964.1 inositol monophosphatase [Microbacterium barkeri]